MARLIIPLLLASKLEILLVAAIGVRQGMPRSICRHYSLTTCSTDPKNGGTPEGLPLDYHAYLLIMRATSKPLRIEYTDVYYCVMKSDNPNESILPGICHKDS